MAREHFDHFFESLSARFHFRRRKEKTASSSSPWDDWELDPKFFATLSRWTREHPENSLDRVLEDICAKIDSGRELMSLVPDSPFPARGLIGALAYLVKLGVTISLATKEVHEFAKYIVHWVGEVKSALEHGNGGRVTSKTRKNLAEMRTLIEEICKWATARLEDGRWSRIRHGLSIAKEIEEFKIRIASARAIFIDLSVINLSQSQDALIQSVRDLVVTIQQTQHEQLSRILDELAAQTEAIESQKEAEEARKQAEARRQFLSQVLSTHVVANTAYNQQGKRPCDSDTRIDILADIREWVYEVSENAQSFLWLTGDPGSGKSAITASVARECKDDQILWAQFFINRNLGNTTNPAYYFPSIARQLADHSPDVAIAVHDVLKEQPSLMDDISQLQAGKLFVESLKVASSTDPSKPVVIIIDGLDETDPTRLRYTAEIFSLALVDLPCNAKVFISSRTEDDIRRPFSATFHVNHVKHIHLDTSAESSIRDVSAFLVRNVAEIVERNNLDVVQWPGEERMRGLCNQASGLFIWAVTTTKFIQDQVDAYGRECLDSILDELNSKGMGDINVLYGTILRLTHRTQTDPWAFETFRRLVGCIVVLQQPLSLVHIGSLLNLRKATSSQAVDIVHHIRRLRTVLVAGTDAVDDQTVPRLHKSFFEFIISERADSRFRVNMNASHGEVAIQCLRQLVGLSKECDGRTAGDYFHSPLRYACKFWTSHLPSGTASGVAVGRLLDLSDLRELCQFSFHDGFQPSSVHITFSSDGQRMFSSSDDVIRLHDVGSGAHFESPLKGHLSKVHSVACSPDGKQIVSCSSDNTLRLWDARSGQPIGTPINAHTAAVFSATFSPDGKQIVSCSADDTLCMWDAQSHQAIGSPFEGHTNIVYCVAFSPDGDKIISGSADNTLRLWDARSGMSIGSAFKGHTGTVYSVAFSPHGKQIVSGSGDSTLRLWDTQSGQTIRSFIGHTTTVSSVAFSPDGKQIVSGSWDGTLHLWDAHNGVCFEPVINSDSGAVFSVTFSLDGKQIMSGSADGTICLWDPRNGQPIGLPFQGHTNAVHSVAFSLDGKHAISGSSDNTLRLWHMGSGKPIELPFKGHTDRVTSMALSPDNSKLVSASSDDTVRMWDAQTGLPIGTPLRGDIHGMISLAFSPDGCLFAGAASDSTIHLWDSESRVLLASYQKEHINMMTPITFSPDGRQLMTFSTDGTTHTWDAANRDPIGTPQSSDICWLDHIRPFSFSVEHGWHQENADEALLKWFPVDNPNFGHWAYIDSTFIRRDRNGLTTIMDTSGVLHIAGKFGQVKNR